MVNIEETPTTKAEEEEENSSTQTNPTTIRCRGNGTATDPLIFSDSEDEQKAQRNTMTSHRGGFENLSEYCLDTGQ